MWLACWAVLAILCLQLDLTSSEDIPKPLNYRGRINSKELGNVNEALLQISTRLRRAGGRRTHPGYIPEARVRNFDDHTRPIQPKHAMLEVDPDEFQKNNWGSGQFTPNNFNPRQLGMQPGRRPAVNIRGRVHWAIISCDSRPYWARTLSNTLVSALASGLPAATITIVWCKHFNSTAVKANSLLNNLQYSRTINVMFIPDDYPIDDLDAATSAQLTAMMIPEYYGVPDLPLLVTEDDVAFAPDMRQRLAQALLDAHTAAQKKPFFLVLYYPEGPVRQAEEIMAEYWKRWWRDPPQRITQRDNVYSYGQQGVVFSPLMTKYMTRHLFQVLSRTYAFQGLMDMNIHHFVHQRFNCSTSPGTIASRPCALFRAEPSLVQHMGAVSSLFRGTNGSDRNPRFHVAWDFPVPLAMAVDDPRGAW